MIMGIMVFSDLLVKLVCFLLFLHHLISLDSRSIVSFAPVQSSLVQSSPVPSGAVFGLP